MEKHIIYPAPPIYSVKTAGREGPGRFSISHRAAASRDLLLISTYAGESRDQKGIGCPAQKLTKPLGRHSNPFAFPTITLRPENGGRKNKNLLTGRQKEK